MEDEQMMDPAAMGQGLDIDGQIASGVEAFIQSQDPQIAIEVCNMLAQQLGIAPELDPYSDQAEPTAAAPAPAPAAAPPAAPMAGNGLKIYRRGGRIQTFADGGKPGGPGKQKTVTKKTVTRKTIPSRPITNQLTNARVNTSQVFNPQDMNQTPAQKAAGAAPAVQNRYTTPALTQSLQENPRKGAVRQNIQNLGLSRGDISQGGGYMIGDKVAYDFGNRKGELAGEMRDLSFDVPALEHTLPGIPTEIVNTNFTDTTVPALTHTGRSAGRNPARAVTMGGSDKNGNPATKRGIGTSNGFKRRSTRSFRPPGSGQ